MYIYICTVQVFSDMLYCLILYHMCIRYILVIPYIYICIEAEGEAAIVLYVILFRNFAANHRACIKYYLTYYVVYIHINRYFVWVVTLYEHVMCRISC